MPPPLPTVAPTPVPTVHSLSAKGLLPVPVVPHGVLPARGARGERPLPLGGPAALALSCMRALVLAGRRAARQGAAYEWHHGVSDISRKRRRHAPCRAPPRPTSGNARCAQPPVWWAKRETAAAAGPAVHSPYAVTRASPAGPTSSCARPPAEARRARRPARNQRARNFNSPAFGPSHTRKPPGFEK